MQRAVRPMRRVVCVAGAAFVLGAALAPTASAAEGFTMSGGPQAPHALASDATRKVYWTADPTGSTAWAYTESGQLAGSVPLGFKAVDIEGMATRNGMLYLGDIGDPQGTRDSVTIYRLGNPAYGSPGAYHAWDFSYPDGPHDAATLMVSPRGTIYIVTRGANAAVYRAPASPTAHGTNHLVRVAAAPAWVTDGTFVSENTVALRTYTSVLLVDPYSWKTLAQEPLSGQGDGQALTTSLDTSTTLMAGSDQQVDPVSVPTTMAQVAPAPSAPPQGSASPSATASTPSVNADISTAKKRTGTFVALGAAICLALAAAAVVAIKR